MNLHANGSASPPGHLRSVLQAARGFRQDGVDAALALVVLTHGSTYRKAGALALIGADGDQIGALSGGCLEPEIQRVAKLAIRDDRAQLVELDTRSDDDALFGSGSGCRGWMRVLLLPWHARGDDRLLAVLEASCHRGGRLQLALDLEPIRLGAWRAWSADQRFASTRPPPAAALEGLRDAPPGIAQVGDAASAAVAVLRIAAPPHVLLLGAGPEAPALVAQLRGLGWFVSVADHRPGWCNRERLANADQLLVARPHAALAALAATPLAAAVVMTHQAGSDAEALAALAPGDVPYVGLLGPPARREELLAQLDADGRRALEPRLHGPAGLDLGGEGAEAIALSIAADLLRHVSGRHQA